jgi:O-antigen/teichoic acid export membrane protein
MISFNAFVILHSLIYIIPALVLLMYLYRTNELNLKLSSIKISKRFKKILIQFSLFNYINSIGNVLVNSLDVMMIAQFVGLQATGVYTTVVFLTSAIQVPFKSILRVSSSLVADYWKHREFDKMKELYQKVSSVSLVIGLGSFVFVWNNIDFLFSFLKPEFQEGKWVFFFLMMGRLIDMFFGLNGSIFSTSKKFKYDIIFIPKWGIAGAAISTSIALIIYNVGRLIFVWAIYKIHPFQRNQFIVIGLGLLTIYFGNLTEDLIQNKWIQCCIESILVFSVFFLPIYLFSLEKETVNYVKKGILFIKEKTGISN